MKAKFFEVNIVNNQPMVTLKIDYEYRGQWTFDNVAKLLGHFIQEDKGYTDFEGVYGVFGDLGDRWQGELIGDFAIAKIIECYEDEMYSRGENWDAFMEEWTRFLELCTTEWNKLLEQSGFSS